MWSGWYFFLLCVALFILFKHEDIPCSMSILALVRFFKLLDKVTDESAPKYCGGRCSLSSPDYINIDSFNLYLYFCKLHKNTHTYIYIYIEYIQYNSLQFQLSNILIFASHNLYMYGFSNTNLLSSSPGAPLHLQRGAHTYSPFEHERDKRLVETS